MNNLRTDLLSIAQDLNAVSGSIDTIKEACSDAEYKPIISMIVVLQNHIQEDVAKLEKLASILKEGAAK